MKKIASTIIILLVSLNLSTAKAENPKGEKALEWHTNFDKARELSTKTGKPIFAFFTGSDWCGWCIRLQKNVFAKEAFIQWAKKEVVLLELDFPKRTKLPEALQKQNQELASIFQVRGFPTVWFFTTSYNNKTKQVEIEPMGSAGYPSGAVPGKEEDKFIENANAVLKK